MRAHTRRDRPRAHEPARPSRAAMRVPHPRPRMKVGFIGLGIMGWPMAGHNKRQGAVKVCSWATALHSPIGHRSRHAIIRLTAPGFGPAPHHAPFDHDARLLLLL